MPAYLRGEVETGLKGSNDLGVRNYTRVFLVETDDIDSDKHPAIIHEVAAVNGLPLLGDSFPQDDLAFAKSLTVTPLKPWRSWHVTYEYTTDVQVNQVTPVDATPKVSFTSEIFQEPVFADKDGKAILNSAGDYFIDPTPTRDNAHLIAKIKVNVASVPTWILGYQNAVNSAGCTIGGLYVGEGLAKLSRIEVSEIQWQGDISYYTLSYEVHCHADGWKLKPLDAGYRYRDDEGALKEIDGATTAVPLNGEGAVLEDPTPDNGIFGEFDVYPTLAFSGLPGIS